MSFTLYDPLTSNVLDGEDMQKIVNMLKDPNLFVIKSNADTAMVQDIAVVDTYQDVIFTNVDVVTGGHITYVDGIVTNTSDEVVIMTLNLSCTLESAVQNNVVIHIGQAQNGVIDPGAESSSECSTAAELQSLNIATEFVLQPDDTLNLKIKANKLDDINIYHFQAVLKQLKIEGVGE